jgi:3-ketosteroid 9alpha-monooxygenase subunit B
VVLSAAVNTPDPDIETRDRHRIKQLEVMVAEAVRETADTTTLVLFTGNDRLDYKAGHFLTIDPHQFEGLERFIAFLEDLKGRKEPPRAYSMASSPHEKYLAVTVKEERYVTGLTQYPPLLSPLPEDIDSRTDHIVHVCAGSGSVPNFAILKYALVQHPRLRHTFVYSNRTWDDVIFRRELEALERAHPERVRLIHTLTREPEPQRHGPNVRSGRVSLELLRDAIQDPTSCRVFACGPAITVWDRKAAREAGTQPTPRFLEAVLESLKALGVKTDQITRESYG